MGDDIVKDLRVLASDLMRANWGGRSASLYEAVGAIEWLRSEVRRLQSEATSTTAPAAGPSREERLVSYRCAAPHLLAGSGDLVGKWTDESVARRCEELAHAMLAAEKEPTDAV